MPVSSSTEHWIKPDALTINLNHFGDPDYLQVSVLAGAVVMAFKQDVIDYNAAHNYRTWPLEAANTYLETSSAYNVYARLTRSEVNARALIVYDTVLRDIEGREISYAENGSEVLGDASADYFFVYLGQISGSVDSNGQSVQREWLIDFRFGSLDTSQYRNEESGGEWQKMFRLNKVTDMIDVLKTFSSAIFKKIFIHEKAVTDVAVKAEVDESSKVSDTILASTAWVTETVEGRYLRKDKDDRTPFNLGVGKSLSVGESVKVGDFVEGTLGSGASIFMRNGSSYSEVDFLKVRKKATFTNITIQELKHVGGEIILSPAAMVVSKVEELEDGYKCYFDTTDYDGRKVYSYFEIGDQARCQTFNLEHNQYYWRLVTEVKEDDGYIILSKTDCDKGSGIPKEGDNISQLGNRTDSSRQSAIILSAYGTDAPSYKQYSGVGATEPYYSLDGKQLTKLSPYGNELTGKLTIEQGSTGWENLGGLQEKFNETEKTINSLEYGKNNLLLNSGFTGDFVTASLQGDYPLDGGSEMFSPSLKYWNHEGASAVEMKNSESTMAVSIGKGGYIEQELQFSVIPNENYIVSFRGYEGKVRFIMGDDTKDFELETDKKLPPTTCIHKFTAKTDGNVFRLEALAACTLFELQLERGTIRSAWGMSPLDNRSELAKYESTTYLKDLIKNASTDVGGGVINSGALLLGCETDEDGHIVNNTSGVSGVYNDDDSVAYWAGGDFAQAHAAVAAYLDNPNYVPTDDELRKMAKYVVTHGGRAILNDVILRGYVYAQGGVFKNVTSPNGNFYIDDDGNVVVSGTFETGKTGNRIVINPTDNSISMRINVGGKDIDVVSLKYETEVGYYDFGKLSLERMRIIKDEYGNEIAFPQDRIYISSDKIEMSRPTDPKITITNEGVNVSKDDLYASVGFKPIWTGGGGSVATKSWIARIASNAWMTRSQASAGDVFVEWQTDPDTYETTEGILKVKV